MGAPKGRKKAFIRFEIFSDLWLLHPTSFIAQDSFLTAIKGHRANLATKLYTSCAAITRYQDGQQKLD
jgi:hypothetical protein